MPCIKLRTTIPKSLRGWILVDDFAIPRYWATIWADTLRANLDDNTRKRHLYAIERLYQFVTKQTGHDCLDQIIAGLDIDRLETALTGFLSLLRNDGTLRGVDNGSVWASALIFIKETVRHLGATSEATFANTQSRLLRLDRLYGQIAPTRPRPPAPIRALPVIVVEDLYRLFDPSSPTNPFRTPALRWRNFVIFLFMLHLGLRRGEVGILPADAIKSDFDSDTGQERYWLNVDETPYEDEDPRLDAPSLKNSQSRRQLPVSEEIVMAADALMMGHRGRTSHSYLFGSQKGNPLALRSIQRVLETASANLSPPAKKALADRGRQGVTCHDLRHTCAVYRLSRYVSQGDSLDSATEKLRVFLGWLPSSDMPRHYARAYFETAQADIWNENYDRVIDALRDIEG